MGGGDERASAPARRAGWSGAGAAAALLHRVPPIVWLAWLVQTVFLVALYATDGYDKARSGEGLRLALTYGLVAAMFGLVHIATRGRARVVTLFVLYTLFVAVNFARFETTGSFDYGFAHENARELLTPLGRHIVAANVKPLEVLFLFVVPLVAGALVARRAKDRAQRTRRPVRHAAAAACVVLVVGVPVGRVSTHESMTAFAASAIRFHAQTRAATLAVDGEPYPYVKAFVPSASARRMAGEDRPRPHVILLFLESWSGRYVDRTRADGRRYTPVFDERRREGLSFDHFYGNSVQSSRGHFATLCGLVPMYRAKEFVDLPATRYHCLPQVMADAGYRTLVHSATDEPDFDRGSEFFHRIGFADVRFEDPSKRGVDPLLWGAGLQDDAFYGKLFAGIDAELAKHPGEPIFAVAMNASNHYPFDQRPGHVPDPAFPTKYQRNYVASLAAADAWLARFFEELDKRPALSDGIVIVVGDHSFPADEHGIHFNGLGSYDEAFHTGFLLRWRGRVAPSLVKDRAASQIDVAPTIADLLQLRFTSHFVGRSLVGDDADTPVPVPLVQPYDGVQLAAVQWPYKLVRQEAADQEHLYDIASDPDEEKDRKADPALAPTLAALRQTVARVHAHQVLMRDNRIWPPAAPVTAR